MVLNSPLIYNLTNNNAANVSITTGLKAIGRPGFILLDKDIDPETKKFSAMKELMYQMVCLGLTFALLPFFNRGIFNLAKKIYKNEAIFKLFDSPKEFDKINKLEPKQKMAELEKLIKEKNLQECSEEIKKDEKLHLVNGVLKISDIISSIAGLAVLAPVLCQPLIRPVLNKLMPPKKQQDQTA